MSEENPQFTGTPELTQEQLDQIANTPPQVSTIPANVYEKIAGYNRPENPELYE